MAILKPIKKDEIISISAKLPKALKTEIETYCIYAGIDSFQDFLIQASNHVLEKTKNLVNLRKKIQGVIIQKLF